MLNMVKRKATNNQCQVNSLFDVLSNKNKTKLKIKDYLN